MMRIEHSAAGAADTPYMRARQEWDARMGNAVVQARNWRRATFASVGALAVSIIGLIYLGSQPKAIAHVIEVDRVGAATYTGVLGDPLATFKPSDPQIKYHLRRFIEDVRVVSSDAAVTKRAWLDAYQMLTSRAANMLTTYVTTVGNDPFKRAQQGTVSVEVLSIVQISESAWQLDWRELSWDPNGNRARSELWRAMFRVLLRAPSTVQDMKSNPIGIYVDEFHWDKVQG
jgi:type IV secretory pathway TrbF-like protein